MDGDRLCCSEFFCFPLSFNFCAVCYSNDKYFYGAVRLLTWKPRTGFLFLKVFLHFFFHHEKFFFKRFSTYTDLNILKFVTTQFVIIQISKFAIVFTRWSSFLWHGDDCRALCYIIHLFLSFITLLATVFDQCAREKFYRHHQILYNV